MSYFADLTPHTYTRPGDATVLNVGWLDSAHSFPRGATSTEFRDTRSLLCRRPVLLRRGFHRCQFCPREDPRVWPPVHPERLGNGQIRVQGASGAWYAAPVMVEHYVIAHGYLPPAEFVEAVLSPAPIAEPGEAR